jgi:iron complex transport system substrate-binding protein
MRCLWPAVLLLAGCRGGPEVTPGGIVSNNPCIDAILAQVAPADIAAVSSWSHDPESASAPLGWARARPALGVTAEEIIAAKPRLLLTGNLASSGANAALAKAGVPMKTFGVPATVEESISQVQDVANAVGQPRAGQRLAADIAAAAKPASGPPKHSAIIWQTGGFVAGKGTLQDELLDRAGFINASGQFGLQQWDVLPLETLVRRPPDIIFMPTMATGEDARALAARQRLLRHLGGRTRIVSFPDRLLFCGGPTIIEAMRVLRSAV